MSILKIVKIPDPILNKKTTPVKTIDAALVKLVSDMMDTCKKANGIGLAAPQVGKSARVCIIDLQHIGLPPFALINPIIKRRSWKKVNLEEGCLSIPGIYGMVRRPKSVRVEAMNLNGEVSKFEADGLMARVIQHEVDHLDGLLFTSKMTEQTAGKPQEKM